MGKLILHILFFFITCSVWCQQNLVSNGNFEEYWECPYQQNDSPIRCSHWYQASYATSDYFNSCSSPLDNGCTVLCATVPQNSVGFQVPRSGEGYCGFVAYSTNTPVEMQYKEYISSKLQLTLEAGEKYVLSFFVSLGDSCKYATDQIGSHLSADSLIIQDLGPCFLTPLITNNQGVLTERENWIEIKDTFQAVGNERYLTIGSFGGYSDMSVTEFPIEINNDSQLTAYYYVDDVTLYKLQNESEVLIELTEFPNILTPNGDNTNDYIDFSLFIPNLESIFIVNRWGNLVHHADNKMNYSWSGLDFNTGEPCSDGTYFYVVETPKRKFSGFIQLIR